MMTLKRTLTLRVPHSFAFFANEWVLNFAKNLGRTTKAAVNPTPLRCRRFDSPLLEKRENGRTRFPLLPTFHGAGYTHR